MTELGLVKTWRMPCVKVMSKSVGAEISVESIGD